MYVILIALFVAFLWAFQIIIHKTLLKNINFKVIMIVGSIFYFLCMCIFTLYYWNIVKHTIYTLDVKSIILIGFASICTAFLANLLYLYILKDTKSYIVSALIYCSPIFTLLLAYFYLKEQITITGLIGVLFIIIGVIFISLNDKEPEEFIVINPIL
jgi:drug/metabolite transporter (DMT)-like permease